MAEEQFNKALKYVNESLKNAGISVTTEQQLQLYSFFKQASIGPCNAPKPSFFDFVGKSKWESWKALGDMDKTQAMEKYVETLDTISPKWNKGGGNGDEASGSQSEPEVTIQKSVGGAFGPVFSTLVFGENEKVPENEKDITFWASEGNVDKVKEKLKEGVSIDAQDSDGRSALMWAADRGQLEMAELLLQSGANVNLQDSEGMTSLHYAAMCEYADIIRLLMKHKADPTLKDNDGKTARDVADENVDGSLFDT